MATSVTHEHCTTCRRMTEHSRITQRLANGELGIDYRTCRECGTEKDFSAV